MKLLISFLVSIVSSQDMKKFSAIVDMVNAKIETSLPYDTIAKRIQNYGCHCFPENSRSLIGYGNPVDALDQACQDLYRCYKCISLEGGDCDTDTGRYKYRINRKNEIVCRNSGCKQQQCLCDAEFAVNVGRVWNDETFNFYFWENKNNKNDIFSREETCIKNDGGIEADGCCGSVPFWVPYNKQTNECCYGNELKSIGSC